ncbi:MAG: hypothetical protein ACR2J6_03745 [Thermoleophilaceae bacterium]
MKRLLAIASLSTALLAPQAAEAKIVELGGKVAPSKVSCPENCQAVGRVTGYQGRGGDVAKPFVIPRSGKVIAFTVRLGAPDANQQRFFNDLYGGPPKVQLSILRRGDKKGKTLTHRLVGQSPQFDVSNFLGSAPSFTLDKPLNVSKGLIVALTVPTWAPAFAVGLKRDHWWRSSRTKGKCDNVSQTAQLIRMQSVKVFGCTYFTARLYYTATYVPDNKPSKKAAKAGSSRVGARTAKGA